VQAQAGRLLFEADGDDITKGGLFFKEAGCRCAVCRAKAARRRGSDQR
jgi:hypothetical protein